MDNDNLMPPGESAPSETPPADPPRLAETALTGPDEGEQTAEVEDQGQEQDQGQDDKKGSESEDDQLDAKPDAPEGYGLNFAEGTQVDEELLGQFQKAAHEMGLTLGQAQKVADLYAGHVTGLTQKYQDAQFQALNDYINTQNAELAKRPDFKEEAGLAKKALKEFGSDELIDVFRQTAMGSCPSMFDFMVKVGRALGEPGFKGGPGRSADPPLYESIWGKDGLGGK